MTIQKGADCISASKPHCSVHIAWLDVDHLPDNMAKKRMNPSPHRSSHWVHPKQTSKTHPRKMGWSTWPSKWRSAILRIYGTNITRGHRIWGEHQTPSLLPTPFIAETLKQNLAAEPLDQVVKVGDESKIPGDMGEHRTMNCKWTFIPRRIMKYMWIHPQISSICSPKPLNAPFQTQTLQEPWQILQNSSMPSWGIGAPRLCWQALTSNMQRSKLQFHHHLNNNQKTVSPLTASESVTTQSEPFWIPNCCTVTSTFSRAKAHRRRTAVVGESVHWGIGRASWMGISKVHRFAAAIRLQRHTRYHRPTTLWCCTLVAMVPTSTIPHQNWDLSCWHWTSGKKLKMIDCSTFNVNVIIKTKILIDSEHPQSRKLSRARRESNTTVVLPKPKDMWISRMDQSILEECRWYPSANQCNCRFKCLVSNQRSRLRFISAN